MAELTTLVMLLISSPDCLRLDLLIVSKSYWKAFSYVG